MTIGSNAPLSATAKIASAGQKLTGNAAPLSAQAIISATGAKIYSPVLIDAISASVKNGDDDTALNVVIQQYIDDWALTETVAGWRAAEYEQLRNWAYPSVAVYYAALIANNQAALAQYYADYAAVDLRFPVGYQANPSTTAETEPYTMTANSADAFAITNLPNPSTVTVTGPGIIPETGISWTMTMGQFVFKVDTAGTYNVTIASGGIYLDKTFTVVAEEP